MEITNIRLPNGTPCASPQAAVDRFRCPGPCDPDCPLYPAIRIHGDDFGHMCHDAIVARYPLSVLDAMNCSYDVKVGSGDPPGQLYAAVIRSSAVRDVQFASTEDTDPLSDSWQDIENAEIWLGFFRDPGALERAARYGNTAPSNVRLMPVSMDMEVEHAGDDEKDGGAE